MPAARAEDGTCAGGPAPLSQPLPRLCTAEEGASAADGESGEPSVPTGPLDPISEFHDEFQQFTSETEGRATAFATPEQQRSVEHSSGIAKEEEEGGGGGGGA